MNGSFAKRMTEVSPELLQHASRFCRRDATMEEVLSCAEAMRDRDKPRDPNRLFLQPFLTETDTRIIRDALVHYNKALPEDTVRAAFLRETFVGYLQDYKVPPTPGVAQSNEQKGEM